MRFLQGITRLLIGISLVWSTNLVAKDDGVLEIGVLPNVSARVLATQYEPMQQYLHSALAQKVAISSAPDWVSFYQRVGRGDYQVVVAASNVGRVMQKDLGYRPILAYQPKIPALFVTLASTSEISVTRLVDGKQVALANPASLVALEGLAWLAGQGLRAGEQFTTLRVRGEDSVGSVLLRGTASAGIMSMGEFNSHPAEIREQLRIHTTFKEVPGFFVLLAPTVSADHGKRIREALLEFGQNSDAGKQFFERSGFKAIVAIDERELARLDAFTEQTRQAIRP